MLLAAAVFCLAWTGGAAAGDDLMAKAVEAWAGRADLAKAKQAAEYYRQAFKADPKNAKAAYTLARVMYWVGGHEKDDKASLLAYKEGMDMGQEASLIDPKDPGGFYWYGVCAGGYGRSYGVMKSLSLIGPIKEAMAEVIALEPGYDQGGAYRVLGRVYFKLPGLLGGDNEQSIKALRTAVKYGPGFLLNYLFLAETLEDEGRKSEALKLLNKVIAGPPPKGMDPEWKEWKATAEKLKKDWE